VSARPIGTPSGFPVASTALAPMAEMGPMGAIDEHAVVAATFNDPPGADATAVEVRLVRATCM
jgi:hypothetical protein